MALFSRQVEKFDQTAREYFAHRKAEASDVASLIEAMEYSFFNGGKRFRPRLCFAAGQSLGLSDEQIIPFAMAVEAIHTYSLIHDDLPCMDDDDTRRGQPTSHKKYGEALALLAGDSLLTEAFQILFWGYKDKASPLVSALAKASGLMGMIRGQVLDLGLGKPLAELSDLIHLHEMKTGQLMGLSFEGPALIRGVNPKPLYELGLLVGLAFQVKDDLLDQEEQDQASFINFLGVQGTQDYLSSLTEKTSSLMKELEIESDELTELIEFNMNRDK